MSVSILKFTAAENPYGYFHCFVSFNLIDKMCKPGSLACESLSPDFSCVNNRTYEYAIIIIYSYILGHSGKNVATKNLQAHLTISANNCGTYLLCCFQNFVLW